MKRLLVAVLFLIWSVKGIAQTPPPMISDLNAYGKSVRDDSLKGMVDLKKAVPGIRLDLRYATKNNFMNRVLYTWAGSTFMRIEAATALHKIQKALNGKGYGLKVFDAYRPWSVSRMMWDIVQDERYVANPFKGSNHNRGLAIDLTIVNKKTGKELDMGTGFDNFTDTAHHTFTALAQTVLNNRKLLKETMEQHGFTSFESEWWHYTWPDSRHYDILNISLQQFYTLMH